MSVVITPELPPGFPTGASVSQTATFHGYFFKLQGYFEAGAAPRSKPLQAPMFLGKLAWQPQAPSAINVERYFWPAAIGLLFITFAFYRVTTWVQNTRRHLGNNRGSMSQDEPLSPDQWLAGMQRASGTGAVRPGTSDANQE